MAGLAERADDISQKCEWHLMASACVCTGGYSCQCAHVIFAR